MNSGKKNKVKIASDNRVASNNDIASNNKIALFNLEVDFKGLKEAVLCLFPEMRYEKVLRYRCETIAKIGIETYRIAKNENIELKPIPPKIALPLVEKMSLEHEPDMYEKWANLLIAAGMNPDPIHQQYADLLLNLNSQSANFLKEIYTQQNEPNEEKIFDEYIDKFRFQKLYKDIEKNARKNNTIEYSKSILSSAIRIFADYRYPMIISGQEKSNVPDNEIQILNDDKFEKEDNYLIFSKNKKNMLLGLEKLGLIKYQFLYRQQHENENNKIIFIEKCGVLLTLFGYLFVDCLEHSIK